MNSDKTNAAQIRITLLQACVAYVSYAVAVLRVIISRSVCIAVR